MYLNSNPFYKFVFLFFIGIICGIHFNLNPAYILGLTLTQILLVLLFLSIEYFYKIKKVTLALWKGVTINFLFFTVGILLVHANLALKRSYHYSNYYTEGAYIVAFVDKVLEEGENSLKTELQITNVLNGDSIFQTKGRVKAYLAKDISLKLGDYIITNARLNSFTAPLNPNEFDYRQYLSYKGISHQVYINSEYAKIKKLDRQEHELIYYAYTARGHLLNLLKTSGISEQNLPIASALLLGYKEKIDDETAANFSGSGAMHVLAVSGLHVGIVYLLFNSLLFFLDRIKAMKYVKPVLVVLLLWCYAFITGMSPSVSRAVTMITLYVFGKAIGRQIQVQNIILSSAFILLVINPFMIKEVGFQLSYAAVIGIIFLYPVFYNTITFKFKAKHVNYVLDKIWILVCISVAAQIATVPLSLYYFHQFPLLFIISNLLVIPIATIVLYLGVVMFMLFPFPFNLAQYLGYTINKLLDGLNFVTEGINNIPHSVLTRVYLTIPMVVVAYLIIVFLFRFVKAQKSYWLQFSLVSAIVMSSLVFINQWHVSQQKKVTVYNVNKQTVLQIYHGRKAYTIHNCKTRKAINQMNYVINHNMGFSGINENIFIDIDDIYKGKTLFYDKGVLAYEDKRMLIDKYFNSKKVSIIKPDYLVGCIHPYENYENNESFFLISDGNCKVKKELLQPNTWYTSIAGAYEFKL